MTQIKAKRYIQNMHKFSSKIRLGMLINVMLIKKNVVMISVTIFFVTIIFVSLSYL